jgi:competence protein ComEC
MPHVTGYHRYTPLRITVPFILGVICMVNAQTGLPAILWIWISLLLFGGLIVFYFIFGTSYRLRWAAGFLAASALFFLGMSLVASIRLKNQPSLAESTALSASPGFICRIDISPVARAGNFTAQATTIAWNDSLNQWKPLRKKVMVYFKSDSLCRLLHYGDLLMISGAMLAVPGPANPKVFDYRKYLQDQQVYYQVYIDPGQWKYLGTATRNPLKVGAEICRNEFLDVFRRFGIDGQEFALAAALLLGSRDFLEKETEQEFSNAGAVHVLSVSGLHVGIMYVVVDKVLFFLKRGRISRKVHHVLIICCIWAYAFITGLPSSVIRAAMMFSLIAAGNMLKRKPENYNILAVAAFFQLLIDPFEITRVGFQLSYLAVLGIFAFYKPLNESIGQVNRPAEWVWSIVAVSLAAQLVTFPLGCYYFHMFPVYFLVTNLLVVPLAAVITYFAVFLLAAGAAGLSSAWLAWPLQHSLRFMIDSVEFIQSWPGAVIQPVIFSRVQVLLIFGFIAGLFSFFIMGYRKWAFVLPVFVILFSLVILMKKYEYHETNEIIVYHVPGNTAIDLVNNGLALFVSDTGLQGNQKKINFQIRPNRINLGVNAVQVINPDDLAPLSGPGIWARWPFIYFHGKKLVLINQDWKRNAVSEPVEADLAVISGSPREEIEVICEQVRMKYLVLDSSVPFYKIELLKESCRKLGIPCHSVREEGAFVMKW